MASDGDSDALSTASLLDRPDKQSPSLRGRSDKQMLISPPGSHRGSASSLENPRNRRWSNRAATSPADMRSTESALARRPLPTRLEQGRTKLSVDDDDAPFGRYIEDGDSAKNTDVARPSTAGETTAGLGITKTDGGRQSDSTAGAIADKPIMEIVIHGTTALKANSKLSHPVVRVTIVDSESGRLYPKLHPERPAVSFYETNQRSCTVVLPTQTQPYNLCQHRTLAPRWDESLFVNEDMSHFTEANNVLLLFEVLDFLPPKKVKSKKWGFIPRPRQTGVDKGWYCAAWAFLKLQSGSGDNNTGIPLNLQLFKVPKIYSLHQTSCEEGSQEVFQWWKSPSRTQYAAHLTVTIRERSLAADSNQGDGITANTSRPRLPFEEEIAPMSFEQLNQETEQRLSSVNLLKSEVEATPVNWNRVSGQACCVPNKESLRISLGPGGCSVIKFSRSGRLLAAGCGPNDDLFGVSLFEIPHGFPRGQLSGHHNRVYDLSWSADDRCLASASSDGTVRCWHVGGEGNINCTILPHPAFVYTAQYHPKDARLIVTGGFDKLLRTWIVSEPAELCHELDGHQGMINTVCFDQKGTRLFSGDSVGDIIIWKRLKQQDVMWDKVCIVQDPNTQGVFVNSLTVSPGGEGLLVQTRNHSLRLLHSSSGRLLGRFTGLVNIKEKMQACVSPCGGLVLCGSELNEVCVWRTSTGELIHRYSGFSLSSPVTCADFHPFENMVAFCTHSANNPMLVYTLDTRLPVLSADADMGGSRQVASGPQGDPEVTSPAFSPPPLLTAPIQDNSIVEHTYKANTALLRNASVTGATAEAAAALPRVATAKVLAKPDPVTSSQVDSQLSTTQQKSGAGITTKMTFADVAVKSSRLQRLAEKLDAVLEDAPLASGATAKLSPTKARKSKADAENVKDKLSTWQKRTGVQTTLGSSVAKSQAPQSTTSADSTFTWNTIWDDTSTAEPTVSRAAKFDGVVDAEEKSHDDAQRVIAAYDYSALKDTEMSFMAGDKLIVLHKENQYWWYVEGGNGRRGYVPSNYLKGEGKIESGHVKAATGSESSRRHTSITTTDGRMSRTASTDSRQKPKRLESRYRRRPSTSPRNS